MISGFDLLRMEFPQHQFCVQDIIPKGLNVLFSENVDKAKSLAMDLALRVAEGQNLWGMEVQQGAVLHMVHKDTLAVTRNRLVSMTKRVPDALYIGVMTESDMELVLSAVPEFMESNPELSLVVVEVETPVAYMSQKLYAPGELLLQYTRLKKLAAEKNITSRPVYYAGKQDLERSILSQFPMIHMPMGAAMPPGVQTASKPISTTININTEDE